VEAIAREKGATPSQLAPAWELAQGDDVVAIPGTTHVKYLEENVGASRVELSEDDLRRIQQVFPAGAAAGERCPEGTMRTLNR
jgi:aryl-alcohol dehydrogenase-like predicted oxidoreductase